MLQKLTGTRKRGLRRKATWEKPTPTCQPCNCAILETDPSVQLSLYMAPADTWQQRFKDTTVELPT